MKKHRKSRILYGTGQGEGLIAGGNGRIIRAKSDDGLELAHCELKWEIPD